MKGLIIKDLLNLSKYLKTSLLFLVVYGLISYSSGNTILLMLMISLLITMMVITSMTEDEATQWDRLALAMPISRKTIVWSKYLLLIILLIAGIIPATGLAYIVMKIKGTLNISIMWLTSYGAVVMALLYVTLAIPFIYKFGTEKTRFLTIIMVAIPVAIGFIIDAIGIPLPSKEQLSILLKVSPILLILFLIASILVSQRIYRQKDI